MAQSSEVVGVRLLTGEDVIRALRLDCRGTNAVNSLNYLRRTGRLKSIRIAGRHLYTQAALDEYIAACAKESQDRS